MRESTWNQRKLWWLRVFTACQCRLKYEGRGNVGLRKWSLYKHRSRIGFDALDWICTIWEDDF